jgi:hypothetical protein
MQAGTTTAERLSQGYMEFGAGVHHFSKVHSKVSHPLSQKRLPLKLRCIISNRHGIDSGLIRTLPISPFGAIQDINLLAMKVTE